MIVMHKKDMLKRLFIDLNASKICAHCFSMANASFNKANKTVSNLLFCRPISHISPPISDDYFFKVQITVPTHIFTTPSCVSAQGWSWPSSATFLRMSLKGVGIWKVQKIAVFDLPESFFTALWDFLFYFGIYSIWYLEFLFLSCGARKNVCQKQNFFPNMRPGRNWGAGHW